MKSLLVLFMMSVALFGAKLPTYLLSDYEEEAQVVQKLEKAGYEIVGKFSPLTSDEYRVIAFTSAEMRKSATRELREFAAVQKVLVNKKSQKLHWQNPEYFIRAYMQKEFDIGISKNITTFINTNFKNITTSKDMMDQDDLSGYHFTFGMPYYEDMKVVGEAKNDVLIQKATTSFGENIVFTVKLADATLMGVKIAGETGENSYINKIDGTNNMAFLPFMIFDVSTLYETKNKIF